MYTHSDWKEETKIMPNAICGCFSLSFLSVELDPLNYKMKVWCSGLMAVFNLKPPVCHCTLCCSGRFTAFRASVSVRVQEAAGNAQLRARIHTWKLPSKTAVWSVGHSWVLNAWPRSCLHIPQCVRKKTWGLNTRSCAFWDKAKKRHIRRVCSSEGSPLHGHCMFVLFFVATGLLHKWHNRNEQTEVLSSISARLLLVVQAVLLPSMLTDEMEIRVMDLWLIQQVWSSPDVAACFFCFFFKAFCTYRSSLPP